MEIASGAGSDVGDRTFPNCHILVRGTHIADVAFRGLGEGLVYSDLSTLLARVQYSEVRRGAQLQPVYRQARLWVGPATP